MNLIDGDFSPFDDAAPLVQEMPFDANAETAILGGILLSNEIMAQVAEEIKSTDFYHQAHQKLFKAMLMLSAKAEPIDSVMLKDVLGKDLETVGGLTFLSKLTDGVPKLSNVTHYTTIIRNHSMRRKIIHAANEVIIKAYNGDVSPGEVLADMTESLAGVGGKSQILGSVEKGKETIKAAIEAANSKSTPGIESHIQTLNDTIGGFRPANLITVGARPGIGKTALAVNFTHHAITQGLKVFFVSAEMSANEIMARLLSVQSRVSADLLINKPGQLTKQNIDQIIEAAEHVCRENFYLIDHSAIHADGLLLTVQLVKQIMGGLDLVLVDYLQLLEGPRRQGQTRADYVAEITRSLKGLAKKFSVPVIALCQLSRAGEEDPSMRNMKESGQIEQDSDVAMILYREQVDIRGEKVWQYKLKVEKNRNGNTGIIKINFDPLTMRFTDQVYS